MRGRSDRPVLTSLTTQACTDRVEDRESRDVHTSLAFADRSTLSTTVLMLALSRFRPLIAHVGKRPHPTLNAIQSSRSIPSHSRLGRDCNHHRLEPGTRSPEVGQHRPSHDDAFLALASSLSIPVLEPFNQRFSDISIPTVSSQQPCDGYSVPLPVLAQRTRFTLRLLALIVSYATIAIAP
jgi:hypothetical protein